MAAAAGAPTRRAPAIVRTAPLPIEQREVTAILVSTKEPGYALYLNNVIDEGGVAQAALPVEEIYKLFDTFVRPVQQVLFFLTAAICVVSGVSILVSIYNSMSERRHEIAVMRALGAGRATVMSIILLESAMLAVGGGLLGWLGGHSVLAAASSRIEAETGVEIGLFSLAPGVDVLAYLGANSTIYRGRLPRRISPELLLLPSLVLLAVVVGFLPAISAYRTDVGKSLGT